MPFPFYKQLDQIDCGSTSLRMVAKFYGQSYTADQIRKYCYVTLEGTSMMGISHGAEVIGQHTQAVRLDYKTLAREAINKVRARESVGMPPIPATVTGDALVKAYRRERAIELSLEGHRFFDIRRWKIGNEVMGKLIYGVNVEKLSTGKIVYSYGTKIADGTLLRKWADRLYWLPIPDREIKASNNSLKQNPGYD